MVTVDGQESFDLHTDMLVRYPIQEIEPPRFDLPPYTGEASCVKCRKGSPMVSYHDRVAGWRPCWEASAHTSLPREAFPEHLDRKCHGCGYEWVEAIADGPVDGR